MRRFLFVVLLLVALPLASASRNHLKVLAVEDNPTGSGITADLFLEVQPGDGRVFIESFPLTKMDTQISTRFAKEIACYDFELNCDQYNFYYTIKAGTALVGGPSASSAAAVLTAAAVEGVNVDESITITGTINSGGLVGPVGGLKEKITAAKNAGLKKVLIPSGERFYKLNSSNTTIDLVSYGKSLGIEVAEVSDLHEAMQHFTGRSFKQSDGNFDIDLSYANTMFNLASTICNKSSNLFSTTANFSDVANSRAIAGNLSKSGRLAFSNRSYYSAASYCYGANVRYKFIELYSKNFSKMQFVSYASDISDSGKKLDVGVPKLSTLADLQSYSSVKERLLDAYDSVNKSVQYYFSNQIEDAYYSLAFAEERVFSARAWSQFMGNGGKKFSFDRDSLESSCRLKISEAEERLEYAKLFLPESISGNRKDLDRAYDDLSSGRFELCLSKASKAKADADVLLSVISVSESQVNELVAKKLEVARRVISSSAKKGVFPIVGYSYYEYASSLKDSDQYSALLYSEYALEYSNMDIYFKKQPSAPKPTSQFSLSPGLFAAFISGLALGAIGVFMALRNPRKKKIYRFKRKL